MLEAVKYSLFRALAHRRDRQVLFGRPCSEDIAHGLGGITDEAMHDTLNAYILLGGNYSLWIPSDNLWCIHPLRPNVDTSARVVQLSPAREGLENYTHQSHNLRLPRY